MESNFELQRLSALLDEALDPSQKLEVLSDLAGDAHLRLELHGLRQARDAVHAQATRHTAPERLAARLRYAFAASRKMPAARRAAGVAAAMQRAWASPRRLAAACALAALALWGAGNGVIDARRDEQLMEAVVTSHHRAKMESRLADVASADRGAVKAWLSSRLPFTDPSGDPHVAATLVGGRIESLDGRSTAAMIYRVGDHVVDVFVLPTRSGTDELITGSLRGYTVSHWTHGGLRYCVVSDLSRAPLVEFARALKQASDLA